MIRFNKDTQLTWLLQYHEVVIQQPGFNLRCSDEVNNGVLFLIVKHRVFLV
jgi:hypothetical protein